MNPRAAVTGMKFVRDCHGECIDATWFADGRCDDGVEVRYLTRLKLSSPVSLLPLLGVAGFDRLQILLNVRWHHYDHQSMWFW
eukprot:COSAG02_NODE_154_length_33067_cov_38.282092_7_plen_83_part_00